MKTLAALLLLVAVLVSAKDGRDFAGFYDAKEVTDLGEQVKVKLTVRVFNYSDADVWGATVTLEDSLLPGETLGTFALKADIRNRESAKLSDEFTIPRREFSQWQKGATPQLRIDYQDAERKQQRRMIELAPMLIDEEEQ